MEYLESAKLVFDTRNIATLKKTQADEYVL